MASEDTLSALPVARTAGSTASDASTPEERAQAQEQMAAMMETRMMIVSRLKLKARLAQQRARETNAGANSALGEIQEEEEGSDAPPNDAPPNDAPLEVQPPTPVEPPRVHELPKVADLSKVADPSKVADASKVAELPNDGGAQTDALESPGGGGQTRGEDLSEKDFDREEEEEEEHRVPSSEERARIGELLRTETDAERQLRAAAAMEQT
ncbi:hypothetical protein T484DRAFT_1778290, partial [Baffinella frigidus]